MTWGAENLNHNESNEVDITNEKLNKLSDKIIKKYWDFDGDWFSYISFIEWWELKHKAEIKWEILLSIKEEILINLIFKFGYFSIEGGW